MEKYDHCHVFLMDGTQIKNYNVIEINMTDDWMIITTDKNKRTIPLKHISNIVEYNSSEE